MNVLTQPYPSFCPPALSPRTASALNALLPLADERGALQWPENSGTLRLLPFPQPFAPAIRATLHWFGGIWPVDVGTVWKDGVGDVDVARVHPLLNNLPADAELPEALRQAALDLLVLAALQTIGGVGGNPYSSEYAVVEPGAPDAVDASEAALWFEATLPDGLRFPVRLGLPDNDAPVQTLLAAFAAEATPGTSASTKLSESGVRRSKMLAELSVAVAVETGTMRLTLAQCCGLSVGDILLPDDYPASDHRIRLVFEGRRPMPVLHCDVCGLSATIEHLTLPSEASMSDSTPSEPNPSDSLAQEQPNLMDEPANHEMNTSEATSVIPFAANAAAEGCFAVPDMDLTVSFELERRLMTVAEVADLRPGHTFTLTSDLLAPVTVRVQGRAVGSGRLVDMGGALGVQITAIY